MFRIYAVGSNDVLTLEIKRAVDQLLENSIAVYPCRAELLSTHTDGDLYICNHSLYKTVEAYTDPGRIAVLNLTPTSAFYLSIREIPYGSNIFIFNNKRKYCEILEHLCRSCGLNDYYYTPLPYDEMPRNELELQLSSAEYIIGVSDVIDDILKKTPFCVLLRPNVKLIGARRIIPVSVTNSIVTQLNRLLLIDCQKQLSNLSQEIEMIQQRDFLYAHYSEISAAIARNSERLQEMVQIDERKESVVVRAAIQQLNV